VEIPEYEHLELIEVIAFNRQFGCRVAGIAMEGERVLLENYEEDDFWALPGGGVNFLEPAEEALRREMREELGVEIRVGRLIWVVENFFTNDGKSYHEVGLYFSMMLPEKAQVRQTSDAFVSKDDTLKTTFGWHRVDELRRITLYPPFLRRGLKRIPDKTEHIIDNRL